ncbi:MAG: ABC transporter substrate-binding protein [Deltaproteobacteria bacterium]|nr:ABC transporter substrate-binding protein [Deltaproteobacteria bacterium]MBW2053333.1 ABC transporter substrate-binding protein [Deltaproteobacteria bacterium]MBW2140101.1 ABC transporter substrate-binding protein [Deltaproteobacteria bacterium]MBW2324479.1 ABC transporter substrate-binding protein [Deltaproteobacteria bacterium]
MKENKQGLTRREFLELGAAGAATAALGAPTAFAETPKRGGTLTCGMAWMIQVPDPQRYTGTWARQASALSYEGLTTPTPVGERLRITKEKGPDAVPDVLPMLAENWEIEKGGSRYIFHLKKGVKFHNGKEFDSADVKWSWERIKDPVHVCSARKMLTEFLKSIDMPDRYTIVANLDRPYGGFLKASAWCNSPLLPKDSIPYGVTWGQTPSFKPPTPAPPGTGPFKLVKFQQKLEAVYERFDDYYVPGLPYLDKVIYKVIPKATPRSLSLRAKNVDYAYGVESNWLSKVLEGRKINELITLEKEGIKLFPRINSVTFSIFLNSHDQADTPFKDERVRQALDYCIDRKQFAQALYGNLGIPMAQGFHPAISSWGYPDIKPREPNIEKARKLLKEAGYPNGLDVELKIFPAWGRMDKAAQIIQQMAGRAGFRFKINVKSGIQYWSGTRVYKYHSKIYLLGGDDPQHFYYLFLHTEAAKPSNGYAPSTGVKDPIMDKLLEEQAGEIDIKKRRAAFKKVVLYNNEKAYLLPYAAAIGSDGWTMKLKNFRPWDYFMPQQAFRETWLES